MITDTVGDLAGDAAGAVAGSAFGQVEAVFVGAANWSIKSLLTLWLKAPDPAVTGPDSVTVWVEAHLAYLVVTVMIGSLMVAGLKLALYGRASDAVSSAEMLARTVIVSSIAGFLITVGLKIADIWTDWILDKADLDLSLAVLKTATIAPGVPLILALIVLLTQLIQVAFMIARSAVVIVMAGTLTLAAATSDTKTGRQWYEKSIAWLLAFILYKPVAALVYAVSFKMASGKGLMEQLSGIFLMVLAVLALPALMKLFVPMTAALGGANAGAIAGAAVGATVAMGAMAATGGMSAGASGAGGFTGGGFSGGGMAGGATGGGAGGGGPSGAARDESAGSGGSPAAAGATSPTGGSGAAGLAESVGDSGSGGPEGGGLESGASGAVGGAVTGAESVTPGAGTGSAGGGPTAGGAAPSSGASGSTGGSGGAGRLVAEGARGASRASGSASEAVSDDSGPSGAGRAD